MKTAAIIAEFNPFHNGHAFLVQQARDAGATHVVAVMSGDFVQRGEPAIADKFVRTRAALAGGVDMVLELPLPYATATAQRFARGGVTILKATGIVDMLAFGSESGDLQTVKRLSRAVDAPQVVVEMKSRLQKGMTFARARQEAVSHFHGDDFAQMLGTPNNALAVEYMRQARLIGWDPQHFTVARVGAPHDAPFPDPDAASASYLRGDPLDFAALRRYMPHTSLEVLEQAHKDGLYPADPAKLEIAMLAWLRRMPKESMVNLPDLSEGLENKLYEAIRAATSLEELHAHLKSKRYTLARVRRLVLAAFLGITRWDQEAPPAYIRVLGVRKSAEPLLSRLGKESVLPVAPSLARLREKGLGAKRYAALEELAGDIYTLALPRPRPCGHELQAKLEKWR